MLFWTNTLLVSAVFFFVSLPAGDPGWWTPLGFLLGVLAVLGMGLLRGDAELPLQLGCAGLCLGMPVLRHLMGGTSWSEALISGGAEILVIDILLLVLGLVLLRAARQQGTETPGPAQIGPVQEPAE